MKKIDWLTEDKTIIDFVPQPKAAKNYMPNWYKETPKYYNNNIKMVSVPNLKEKRPNLTMKSCMPFMDTFLMGYIQETWCDLYIIKTEESIEYEWALDPPIISHRENVSSSELLKNDEFYNIEFEWRQYWIPKLPNGYSMLYTHPLNRTDLPFYSLTGVVDSDVFYTHQNGGAHPFYIKKDFVGLIPAGTPMYQMIPIKREKWNSNKGRHQESNGISPRRFFQDGYKKLYWQKKEYL